MKTQYIFFFLLCFASKQLSAQCTGISLVDTIKTCTGTANLSAILSIAPGDVVIDTGWTPTTGLSDTNSLTPTVTVTSGTLYKLHLVTLTSANLVANGDFSAGNTGFSSSYLYTAPPASILYEGYYSVTTDPHVVHSSFDHFTDHTTGTGNMMVLNGASTPVDVWCETIAVTPNTYYAFSAWFANCSFLDTPGYYPILQFKINGSLLGAIDTLSSARGVWKQFYTTWYSGSNTSATICLYDELTAAVGNDFAIDDISFRKFCTSDDSVFIKPDTLHVTGGPDTSICNGYVSLYAVGAGSYTWSPSTGLSCTACANPVASPTVTTTYVVTGTKSGCSASDTVTINVGNLTVHISGPAKICVGETADLKASGATKYTWNSSSNLSCDTCAEIIVTPTTSTKYIVMGADSSCAGKDSIVVIVDTLPVIKVQPDPNAVCKDHSTKLIATGGVKYTWSPGTYLNDSTSANPTIANLDKAITFLITGTNDDGCKNTDTITVQPFKDAVVGMPSAFSPNGDGVNDIFYIRGTNVASLNCSIYNRWGKRVFESNDMKIGWDGSYNGAKQPIDAYACVVKIRTLDGCEIVKKGSVSIVK